MMNALVLVFILQLMVALVLAFTVLLNIPDIGKVVAVILTVSSGVLTISLFVTSLICMRGTE